MKKGLVFVLFVWGSLHAEIFYNPEQAVEEKPHSFFITQAEFPQESPVTAP